MHENLKLGVCFHSLHCPIFIEKTHENSCHGISMSFVWNLKQVWFCLYIFNSLGWALNSGDLTMGFFNLVFYAKLTTENIYKQICIRALNSYDCSFFLNYCEHVFNEWLYFCSCSLSPRSCNFLLHSTIGLVTFGKGLHSNAGKRFCVCGKSMWQNLLLCWRKWWRQVHSPCQ